MEANDLDLITQIFNQVMNVQTTGWKIQSDLKTVTDIVIHVLMQIFQAQSQDIDSEPEPEPEPESESESESASISFYPSSDGVQDDKLAVREQGIKASSAKTELETMVTIPPVEHELKRVLDFSDTDLETITKNMLEFLDSSEEIESAKLCEYLSKIRSSRRYLEYLESLFNTAALKRKYELCKFLLPLFPSIHAEVFTEILRNAALKGHPEIVALLCECGRTLKELKLYRDKNDDSILSLAAFSGEITGVKYLLQLPEIYMKDLLYKKNQFGQTALMLAAAQGHKEIVNLLLDDYGMSLNEIFSYRSAASNTLLMLAASRGYSKGVEYLLSLPEINTKSFLAIRNLYGETALTLAIYHGHKDIADLLRNTGASIDEIISYQDKQGNTFLARIAWNGCYDALEYLLERTTIDIKNIANIPNHRGQTALMIAAQKGYSYILDVLKILNFSIKEIMEYRDEHDRTFLMRAAEGGNLVLINYLLNLSDLPKKAFLDIRSKNAGAYPHNYYGLTALMFAVRKGSYNTAKLLIEHGATADELLKFRDCFCPFGSLLSFYIYNGDVDAVKCLFSLLPDSLKKELLSIKNRCGESALITAAYKGYTDIINLLINFGAPADELWTFRTAGKGGTILTEALDCQGKYSFLACQCFVELSLKYPELKKILDLPDRTGRTPIIYAAIQGDSNSVKILSENEVSIENIFKYRSMGGTILHNAISQAALDKNVNGVKCIVNLIKLTTIDLKSFLNVRDESGKTVLHHAASLNTLEIFKYLLNCGAKIGLLTNDGLNEQELALKIRKPLIANFIGDVYSLMNSVSGGKIETVQRWFQEGNTPFLRDNENRTLLHLAARYAKKHIYLFLLQQKLDENATDDNGLTPLETAAISNNFEFLIEVFKALAFDLRNQTGISDEEKKKRIYELQQEFTRLIKFAKNKNIQIDYNFIASNFNPIYWEVFANKWAFVCLTQAEFISGKLTLKVYEQFKDNKEILAKLIFAGTLKVIKSFDENYSFKLDHKFKSDSLDLSKGSIETKKIAETKAEKCLRLGWSLKFALEARDTDLATLISELLIGRNLYLSTLLQQNTLNKTINDVIVNAAIQIFDMTHAKKALECLSPIRPSQSQDAEAEPLLFSSGASAKSGAQSALSLQSKSQTTYKEETTRDCRPSSSLNLL